ncbi:MAG: PEGA domain-containing protein [bacterium]|nr:PEGA domain-containing protein [bacterium]
MDYVIRIWVVISLTFIPAIVIAEDIEANSFEEDATLNIASNPSEAEVYINDILIGKTPLLEVGVRPGKYRVESRLKNTPDVGITLILSEGQIADLEFVHNDSGENRSWVSRHTILFGGMVGFGILLLAFAAVAGWASGLN